MTKAEKANERIAMYCIELARGLQSHPGIRKRFGIDMSLPEIVRRLRNLMGGSNE